MSGSKSKVTSSGRKCWGRQDPIDPGRSGGLARPQSPLDRPVCRCLELRTALRSVECKRRLLLATFEASLSRCSRGILVFECYHMLARSSLKFRPSLNLFSYFRTFDESS